MIKTILNSDYHADNSAISKSGLDLIDIAPAKYYHKYLSGNHIPQSTDTFLTGTAFHSFVLEPEKLENEYIVMPEYSGKGKFEKINNFKLLNHNKTVINLKTYETVARMRDSVLNHRGCQRLLSGGKAEQSVYWTNPETGVKCKCRPDYLGEYGIDLKSTVDASERGFKKSTYKYRYDVQGAFYTDGVNENGVFPEGFIFIAVEKTAPFLVNIFYMGNEAHDSGRLKYLENLQTYKECKLTGEWPGYGDEIKLLEV